MSGKGDYDDNAVSESFFPILKIEHVHQHIYSMRTEARQSIFEYIKIVYNSQRKHLALGKRSPGFFELDALAY